MNVLSSAVGSLRARVMVLVTLLVAGSLLIGGGAVVGIMGLDQNMGMAVRGYRELREVYEVGSHVAAARAALNDGMRDKALMDVEFAQTMLASDDRTGDSATRPWIDDNRRRTLAETIGASATVLRDDRPGGTAAATLVNSALGELAQTAADVRVTIESHEQSANRAKRAVLAMISALSLMVVVAGAWLGVRLYRSVLRPLDRIGVGVQRFAAGELDHRLAAEQDQEFAALSGAFNDMAGELAQFHRQLEEQVEIKSRQLVQSERLASVGYLAAGVAHEINNPLSIIAGYGERSMKLLDRQDEKSRAAILQAIGIMCDEAFRCKKITDRLLMLARPGEQSRGSVSLARVAGDVVNSLGGLDRFSDRRIVLAAESDEQVTVLACEGEIRQVVLNLLVNALEAVTAEAGEVRVDVVRRGTNVELAVRDNGRGMSAETVSRVFEPFFTEKRAERPGTGLGLSVCMRS